MHVVVRIMLNPPLPADRLVHPLRSSPPVLPSWSGCPESCLWCAECHPCRPSPADTCPLRCGHHRRGVVVDAVHGAAAVSVWKE